MSEIGNDRLARLDGNVAAGLLAQVFRCEPSSAVIVCAGCGASAPIGALLAYGLEMGAILRCSACDTAVIRVSTTERALWVDLRGAVSLRMESSAG